MGGKIYNASALSALVVIVLTVVFDKCWAQAVGLRAVQSEIARLTGELSQNAARLQALKADASAALEEKNRLIASAATIEAESAAIEAQKPSVIALCHRRVPKRQVAAASARCDAVLIPYNNRVKAHDATVRRLAAQHESLIKRMRAYLDETNQLEARRDQLSQRLASLRAQGAGTKISPEPLTNSGAAAKAISPLPKSASCSTITGLGGGGAASSNCKTGNTLLARARAARQRNPKAVGTMYQRAAEAYRRAGDVALANAVLKEALQLAGSGSRAPPPATTPAAADTPAAVSSRQNPQIQSNAAPYQDPNPGVVHWRHSEDPADCANANSVERSSAEWGYMCVRWRHTSGRDDCWLAHPDERQTDEWKQKCGGAFAYNPYPDPQKLSLEVYQICGSWSRVTRQCYIDNKIRIILERNPAVRSACKDLASAKLARSAQVFDPTARMPVDPNDTPFNRCADRVYLYGPDAQYEVQEPLSVLLHNLLNATDDVSPTAENRRPPDEPRSSQCPRGYGLAPDRSAFGAWTCQTLGWPDREKKDGWGNVIRQDEAINHFEKRTEDIAVETANVVGTRLSASETCKLAAAQAVHSLMKGGKVSVPVGCADVINAARVEFVYNAKWGIDAFDPGVAQLYSYLTTTNSSTGGSVGGNLGPPLPGMTDLKPDAANRRLIECVDAETEWKLVEQENVLSLYEDYLRRFRNCKFAAQAQARIDKLKQKPTGKDCGEMNWEQALLAGCYKARPL